MSVFAFHILLSLALGMLTVAWAAYVAQARATPELLGQGVLGGFVVFAVGAVGAIIAQLIERTKKPQTPKP